MFLRRSNGEVQFGPRSTWRRSLPARGWRRLLRMRRRRRRLAEQGSAPLKLLIKVFAGFVQEDGEIEESEIDSVLGFLRYDYPESMYSELRSLFTEALDQKQDLFGMAGELSNKLSTEAKLLLGVQLFSFISRHEEEKEGASRQHLSTFYHFMTQLGIALEAVDLVYQFQAEEPTSSRTDAEEQDQSEQPTAGSEPQFQITPEFPLEILRFGPHKPTDVLVSSMGEEQALAAFRLGEMILIKNIGKESLLVRGRWLKAGNFRRLYTGQSLVLGDSVFRTVDLQAAFNAAKEVSHTKLYLAFEEDGAVLASRQETKESTLEVSFGLNCRVRVLRPLESSATLNGEGLGPGYDQVVSIESKIVLESGGEVMLDELRRRARELGGRFELAPHRTVYLVSNNSDLLEPGDILLSPETPGDLLLRITCDYDHKTGLLEVIRGSGSVELHSQVVRHRAPLRDGDFIHLGSNQYLRCNFSERLIEEERNLIRQLEVADLTVEFSRNIRALDAVSFSARRGETICVMGPSGCGKSTMLRAMAGHLNPTGGEVLIDGHSLYDHVDHYRPYISFMPHEEAFDSNLTVYENLALAARLRAPHFSSRELRRRVEAKLAELGLAERSTQRAGRPGQKLLSGGERKRLNLGMDMIGRSDVYLLDEPTSGLSSKDSEHVIEIIKSLSHNKIVLVTVHQPSARLLHLFHKCLLLDHGGRVAFFGPPQEMLNYFHDAALEQGVLESLPPAGDDPSERFEQPERVFDVLECPLRDPAGEVIFFEDDRGHVTPSRRFSPGFWRDRFAAHRLAEQVRDQSVRMPGERATSRTPRGEIPPKPKHSVLEHLALWRTHFLRSFLSRLRNKTNIFATLLEAPALALLVGLALRYAEADSYTFGNSFHIPTYLFLSLVVAMFLGLTNSADEIINDRALIDRERNHSPRPAYYLSAKVLVLAMFGLVQCILYLAIGNWVIGIRGMMLEHLEWMFYSSLAGIGGGLFVSSLVRDGKTAVNLVPLMLVPQIILGGALIRYEEINKDFHQLNDFAHWRPFDVSDEPSQLAVPFPCEFMPLRWTYEGAVITQAGHNPLAESVNQIQRATKAIIEVGKRKRELGDDLNEQERAYLTQLKQARVALFSLRGNDAEDIDRRMKLITRDALAGTYNRALIGDARDAPVTAEQIYTNDKTQALFDKAEMERLDISRAVEPNVFFGSEKTFEISTNEENRWEFEKNVFSSEHVDALFEGRESWLVSLDTRMVNRFVALLFPVFAIFLTWLRVHRFLRKI